MTVLSDFIREVADALDARAGKPWRPLPRLTASCWSAGRFSPLGALEHQ
jgi:hypothetical protein